MTRPRAGVSQVKNWREWIVDNPGRCPPDYKQRMGWDFPESVNVTKDWCSSAVANLSTTTLRTFVDSSMKTPGIAVHTYDWLIEVIGKSMSSIGPPPGASHLLQLY